ncbi:transglycosylase SLT domain-containing protein [Undibacterium sp. TS12]|uniref:transglycosylase SLT domain-containing protein n=1 Tax=Undibacterium sp. TS12 TaxID=2908202 RepID=UPI001F4CCC8C|nr:transglycosylase SLT domain-containing protein [Undibacterium sp. TS12]MCH8622161.1 transglycosylase SLT domain-containing protein [Undibacterium sp. TS12]
MKRFRLHSASLTSLCTATLLVSLTPQICLADAPATAFSLASAPETTTSVQNATLPVTLELPADVANFDYTDKTTDLWERVRSGYAIPDLENQLVSNQLAWYSTRTDYILRTVQRGSRYLYHVVEELEKRGMPTELALLPFIESAFNPQAISTAKATGMWQFMAATGRDFNLKQTMFKDDRRGVLDSTDAALNYLEKLYGMFGDWQLALAAYNWGEGSVQRAIKKQQAKGLPIDFQSLSVHMPNETKNYLPKLQAVKNIIAHPEQFNLALPKLDNQPYFVTVEKTRDIDVRVAAQLAELSMDEFTALNPQFNRPVIAGDSNTKILLPTDNAALFKTNLNKWQGPLSSWSAHTVQKTERIETLASKLGLKPEVVREVNLIPAKMMVKAGSTLLVPKSDKSPDHDISLDIAEKAQIVIEKTSMRQVSYKVGKHENLAGVAKRFRVSIAELKSWNHLKHENIARGQTLRIQTPIVTQVNQTTVQAVQAGHHAPAIKVTHRQAAPSRSGKSLIAHFKAGRKKHG